MTNGAQLESFQLADPFLPVGTYIASYGPEQFVQGELISDADDFRALLSVYLKQQVGPCELIALRVAYTVTRDGNFDTVCRADRRLTATTLSKEFRKSARQPGNHPLPLQRKLRESSLLDEYIKAVNAGDTTGNYAVVLNVAAASADIGAPEACLLCYHGLVIELVEATQRVLSLGRTDTQRILHDLQPMMTEAAADSADRGIDEMLSFAPLIDVFSVNHERASRRLLTS